MARKLHLDKHNPDLVVLDDYNTMPYNVKFGGTITHGKELEAHKQQSKEIIQQSVCMHVVFMFDRPGVMLFCFVYLVRYFVEVNRITIESEKYLVHDKLSIKF